MKVMHNQLYKFEFVGGTEMIHHWFGWISFAMCILLLAKYIGRISKNKKINQSLRKIHKILGIAVIGIAFLHGIICFIKTPQAIIQNITGLILWILIISLAATFYARARLKAKWFQMHRYLSIILCVIMVIHIVLSISL